LNLSIITAASSSQNPLAKRFFKDVAASQTGTSPSDVNFFINTSAFLKSPPVPFTIDPNPIKAFCCFVAASMALFDTVIIPKNAAQAAAAKTANPAAFFFKVSQRLSTPLETSPSLLLASAVPSTRVLSMRVVSAIGFWVRFCLYYILNENQIKNSLVIVIHPI